MKTWLRLLLVVSTVGGGFTGFSLAANGFSSFMEHGLATGLGGLTIMALYGFVTAAGLLFVYDSRRTRPMLAAIALQIPWVSLPVFEYHFAAASYIAITLVLPQGPGLIGTNVEWSALLGADCKFRFASVLEGPSSVGINLFAVLLYVLLRLSVRRFSRSPEAAPTLPAG
jgi:hypothetical protein